jgi:hypothetical protein
MKKAGPAAAKFQRGRKGPVSTLEAVAMALRPKVNDPWPERSFGELAKLATNAVGRDIATATVRQIIYTHPRYFERANKDPKPKWRLTREMREFVRWLR